MDGFKATKLLNEKGNSSFNIPVSLAVLVSGKGSNLAALINAVNIGNIANAKISLVISNKKDAAALTIARDADIPTVYIDRNLFNSDEEYDLFLLNKLKEFDISLIIMAGYLRIITAPFLKAYKNRILNIHPSLLPDFGGKGMYGMKVHQAVINSKAKKSGCTVHLVTEKIDGGSILAQESVPVTSDDTPKLLAAKILTEEHKLYPLAINEFISTIILNNK